MKLDGRQLAEKICADLKKRVRELQKKGITPGLAVILIGNDPASVVYVNQKKKKAEEIGAKVNIYHLEEKINTNKLQTMIKKLNADKSAHGILIQRPLPPQIDINKIELAVDPRKDVDGFHPGSPFTFPLPLAVIKILEEIYKDKYQKKSNTFDTWLKSQKIAVIGKGEGGGKPIIAYLKKLGLEPEVIDSKTGNANEILKKADIVIPSVGKPNIVRHETMKNGAILIGVGLFRGEDEKLHGDYNEEEIADKASFYTPTPRGVGPVNVAMLMENLITAAESSLIL